MRGFVMAAFMVGCVAPQSFAADFYPLAKGNKWEYKLEVNGMTIEITQEVTEVTEKQGEPKFATLAAVIKAKGKEQKIQEVYSFDEKGVYRNSINGIKYSSPCTAIKFPAKAGVKWKETIKVQSDEVKADSEILKEETIDIGGVKYKAIPVKTINDSLGEKHTSTIWYAEGVGPIKQEMDFGTYSSKMILVKFTPAK